jgi:hypothetical protein
VRILNFKNIFWEYERYKFLFGKEEITYTPDFYIPEFDTWVEISGQVDDRKKKCIELFKKYYPNKKFYHITKDDWYKLKMLYRYVIPEWEH